MTRCWMVVLVTGLGLGGDLACRSDASIGNLVDGGSEAAADLTRPDAARSITQWVARAGGTTADAARAIAVDPSGNVLIAGSFSGTASFGGTLLTATHAHESFVAKLDPQGSFLWARALGGTWQQKFQAVTVDGAGNVYVAASFADGANVGSATLLAKGPADVLVVKLDGSGQVRWAASGTRAIGLNDGGIGIAVDASGAATVVGTFVGTATFGASTLASAGDEEIFVAHVDPLGEILWAVAAGGTETDLGNAVAVDGAGIIHITGMFTGKARFGPDLQLDAGGEWGSSVPGKPGLQWMSHRQCYLGRLGVSGSFLSASAVAVADQGFCRAIALDQSGVALSGGICASYGLTTCLNPAPFVVRTDLRGNVSWTAAGTPGESKEAVGAGVASDAAGQAAVVGRFVPGTEALSLGSTKLTSRGKSDLFVARAATGAFNWAVAAGGVDDDSGNAVAVDPAGNVHVAGSFGGTAHFDGTSVTSTGSSDAFVWKLRP